MSRFFFALVTAVFTIMVSVHAKPVDSADRPAPTIRAGAAKVDITPDLRDLPISLNGYGDRRRSKAEGIADPLHARALYLQDDDGNAVALVAVDLCYVTTVVRDRVVAKLARDGFDETNVLLAATHNHSGFAGYDKAFIARVAMGNYDEDVLDFLVDGIVTAVREAQRTARPAAVAMRAEPVEGLNRSRLDPGFVHGYESANKAAPEGLHPVERTMSVLRFVDKQGFDIAAVVHFTAHPTVLSPRNMRISADYPGVVCRDVEASMGEGAVALFFNGPLGDAAPNPDWDDNADDFEQMELYGRDVANAAISLLQAAAPLPMDTVDTEARREEFERVVIRTWNRAELPLFLSRAFYADPEVTFQVVRTGPLYWLAVPGEATYETGRNYQALCPKDAPCIVVGPANAYMGYLVTREQYEVDGYESDSCFFGPDAAARVGEEFRRVFSRWTAK